MVNHRDTVRFNLSVPQADTSVLRWLEAQDNRSVSVRTIIREYIERDGYTDPMCRIVEQGPRRGRPPGGTTRRDDDSSSDVLGARDDRFAFDDGSDSVPIRRDDVSTTRRRGDAASARRVVDQDVESESRARPDVEVDLAQERSESIEDAMTVMRDPSRDDDAMPDILSSLRD